VADCYGVAFDYLAAPEGYEFSGDFRPPTAQEYWMTFCTHAAEIGSSFAMPALILRKRPKRKRIIFEQNDDGLWRKDYLSGHVVSADAPGYQGLRFNRREEEF
jgi:hypothetical protein